MRVLESRSQRASGTAFPPKCAHKTSNYIIVLCEMAHCAVTADVRRKSADDRRTPAASSLLHRLDLVQAMQGLGSAGSLVGDPPTTGSPTGIGMYRRARARTF